MHMHPFGVLLASFKMWPVLVDSIFNVLIKDPKLRIIKNKNEKGLNMEFSIRKDGAIMFKGRLCVLNILKLKREILEQAHNSIYVIYLGSTKMYRMWVK